MKKDFQILGFIQAKNEYPLILMSVIYALKNHVDRVYIINDHSDDLSEHAFNFLQLYWKGRVHITNVHNDSFQQEEKINLAIRLANPKPSDWIYVFDADEFLITKNNQPLKHIIKNLKSASAIRYSLTNWISYTDFNDDNFNDYNQIFYRSNPSLGTIDYKLQIKNISKGKNTFFDYQFNKKIIFKFKEDCWLSAGSHEIRPQSMFKAIDVNKSLIDGVHLPFISKARLYKKALTGEKHIKERSPKFHGWQNQLLYRYKKLGKLDRFWLSHSLDRKLTKQSIQNITFDRKFSRAILSTVSILKKKWPNYLSKDIKISPGPSTYLSFESVSSLLSSVARINKKVKDDVIREQSYTQNKKNLFKVFLNIKNIINKAFYS